MKRTNLYSLFIFVGLIINGGCTEETLPTGSRTSILPPTYTIPPTTASPAQTATVSAGENLQVILPANFCWLSGNYSYVEARDIDKILWKKYMDHLPTYWKIKIR